MSFKSVVVLGGGPIGLMCAIEARQSFVQDVTIVEKRSDYTRTNVPSLDNDIVKHLTKVGVADRLWDKARHQQVGDSVAFSRIEEELWRRAQQIGVKMRRGYVVEGLMGRDMKRNGRYKSIGLSLRRWDEAHKRKASDGPGVKPGDNWATLDADLLVIASGGGASGDALVTRKLGFEFEVLDAKNYGAYGIFEETDDEANPETTAVPLVNRIVGDKIAFTTTDHNYLLVTLSQVTPGDFGRLKSDLAALTQVLTGVSKVFQTRLLGEIKQVEKNMAVFEISIQRARQFYSPTYPAVLVGDASVTPHPEAGSGIGTGFKGFRELQVLMAALKGTHRSRDNRAAFMAFNQRYELHASRKALEGTAIVLKYVQEMLRGFKDDIARSSPGTSQAFAELKRQMTRTTDALLNILGIYTARTKEFQKILTEDNALPPDWAWNDTAGALWHEINSTYGQIVTLTKDYTMLGDRLDAMVAKLKLK